MTLLEVVDTVQPFPRNAPWPTSPLLVPGPLVVPQRAELCCPGCFLMKQALHHFCTLPAKGLVILLETLVLERDEEPKLE